MTETAAADPPPTSAQVTPPTGGGSAAEESGGFGDLPTTVPSDEPSGGTGSSTTAPESATEGGDPTAPGDDGESEPPSAEESDVEPLACPASVEVVICDAAEFVQRTRGRPFKTFPEVEILDDTAFDAALLDDFEEYRDLLDTDDVTLTALGLLDPSVSLAEVFRDSLEVGVVGFYDPETGRLVVRGVDLDLYGQLVLVHELVHAFDDQWFDLGRDDFADDEADYGFSAVIEGNASRVESLWRSQLSSQEQLELTQQELTALSADDVDRLLALPPVVRDLQGSPYLDGEVYVDALVASGGEDAVDQALLVPPSTSEEVLHPGLDRAADVEIAVVAPPADGAVVDEGRLGELVVRLWLGRLAGEGWGGDRFVTWTAGGRDCIRVDLIGDDEAETIELDAAADAWAGLDRSDRRVEPTTIDGSDGVRVTACS